MLGRWTTLLLVAALLTGACANDEDDPLVVLAASSLTDVFQEIEVAFEQANPGVDVQLSFAGSSALRLQIDQGAPADVLAVANEDVMTALAGEGHVALPTVFATNRLVVAAPTDGTASVTGPGDLADPDLLVGLCDEQVPCGQYATEALALIDVEPSVDTFESDVRALTTKLAIGELDVGVAYATDVTSRPDDLIAVAPLDGIEVLYPIAPLMDAPHAEPAESFVAFVLSAQGRTILEARGFGTP